MGLAVLAALACSSNKNHDERAAVATARPAYCVDQCLPDPAPQPVDCAAIEEHDTYEYMPIWDFEYVTLPMGPPEQWQPPTATGLYIYDDQSVCQHRDVCDDRHSFRFPTQGYEPPTAQIARCGGQATHALHIWGGPFLSWGGGFGRRLTGSAAVPCVDCPDEKDPEFPNETLNLSEWEGFSFWARRGPDGQAGVRIGIGDKYTDDDLSFVSYVRDPSRPRHCERNKECGCRSKPCSDDGTGAFYCYDPAVDPPPSLVGGKETYDLCGVSACNAPYDAFPNVLTDVCQNNPANCRTCSENPQSCSGAGGGRDPQFYGKACTPFDFRGSITGSYCFNPGQDPNPFEGTDLCGDLWVKAVNLSTEWQFYRVPFDELLQQGWAKESHFLDLVAASMIRFTFDRGWIDYWIDDVSFYRKKSAP